jgi:hypothetical protein
MLGSYDLHMESAGFKIKGPAVKLKLMAEIELKLPINKNIKRKEHQSKILMNHCYQGVSYDSAICMCGKRQR